MDNLVIKIKDSLAAIVFNPELLYMVDDHDLEALELLINMHLQLKKSNFLDGHFYDRD